MAQGPLGGRGTTRMSAQRNLRRTDRLLGDRSALRGRSTGCQTPGGEQDKSKTAVWREFPGGPVVRTQRSHFQGPGFDPWSGKIPEAAGRTPKKTPKE